MPAEFVSGAGRSWSSRFGMLFPLLIVLSVVVMIVPLPAVVLDLLLACNITLAVMVLLTAIQVGRPLEFSVFPALLLGTTLTRLVLNIASTRLILSRGGDYGLDAAGDIVRSFGEFVAQGNLAIGFVIFAILIAIQFLVITKGATRISEVAARFMLDGLPGKQLAIDADLNAGLIDKHEAARRREELSQQADFYGAMDGAGKFVRGDALAGLVITGINLLGGLYIGVFQHGLGLGEAAQIFTTLTIGDGLVSQIPAFLIALGAAFLVTRSSVASNLSRDVVGQMVQHPAAMFLSAGFLMLLSLTGLPKLPLMSLAGGCLFLGFVLQNQQQPQISEETPVSEPQPAEANDLFQKLHVEPLELLLGIGLLKLTRPEAGDLLNRVTRLRQELAEELGLILPSVSIRDQITLGRNEYRIRIRGVEVAQGTAWPDGFLALETPQTTGQVAGIDLPNGSAFARARWITPDKTEAAKSLGYRVVEPVTALMIHFAEVIREHAEHLLTREHVHDLLDRLKRQSPRLVEELHSTEHSTSALHRTLANLLRERVPIRDLETIVEVCGDRSNASRDEAALTERIRLALAGTICQQYRDASRVLKAVVFDGAWEQILLRGLERKPYHKSLGISVVDRDQLVFELEQLSARCAAEGLPFVIVCDSRIRAGLHQLLHADLPRLAVVSRDEITRATHVVPLAVVRREEIEPSLVGAPRFERPALHSPSEHGSPA